MAPEQGVSVKNDIYFYSAESDLNLLSGNVSSNLDIELLYNYTTVLYKTEYTLFGAEYAAATIAYGGPDISTDISLGGHSTRVGDSLNNLGDLTLAPILLYWNDGNFNYSFSQYVVAPTASYDSDRIANSGLNYWTFESDIAASYTNFETGQDYSVIVGYNYNTENKDTNYQTGQEVHIDVVLNQFVSETLAFGVQAFHLQQISKDKGAGANLGSFKARATGLGPSVAWMPSFFKVVSPLQLNG